MLLKFTKLVLFLALVLGSISFSGTNVEAATSKVMWGKTELKLGQIGKVTILQNVPLVKMDKNGGLTTVRGLKKGDEFRVYSYRQGLYGVGGGQYINRNDVSVKYETPSKSKLALLSGKTPVVTLPAPKPVKPNPNPIVVKDKNAVYKEKLNTIKNTKYEDYKGYAEAIYKVHQEIKSDNFNGKYELEQEIRDLYYLNGIEVDELVFTFDNGVSLSVFERSPASFNNDYPTNRSAIFYNNEYYLNIGFIEKILSGALDMYYFDKPRESTVRDGQFSQMGPSYQYGSEFKDPSNKKLGAYNTVYIKNHLDNKTLMISEKEFPWADAGTGTLMSSALNPYSIDEVKDIFGINFDLKYDSKNAVMTIHFNKPSKEKSWIFNN